MPALQSALIYIVNYLPAVLVGILVYRKMKARYRRPLHEGTDPRVYVITVFCAAMTLLVTTVLLYFLISAYVVGLSA